MRGAVSIALAYNQFTRLGHTKLRENAIMITSTITVVLFSTLAFGLMTKPLVRLLLPCVPTIDTKIIHSATSWQWKRGFIKDQWWHPKLISWSV
ncbi:sodium/hydrogen exchanger 2-like [Vigna umbellata]|uniref:sodium/hydrogen exchanger 2-like n=1 Tax=Vigna umbellata TaxID=87088 RepID=UPI001F5F4CFC|nr:sodium/hydrogen exchanger 2-like [Vigna umbellata]